MRTRLFFAMVCGVVGWLIASLSFAQNCVIDGFNNTRAQGSYSLTDGAQFARMRGFLSNPNYFGAASGAVPLNVTVRSGVATATAGSLAGANVFVTGWTTTSSYTAAERTALMNFVLGGGNLIIMADDTDHSIVSDYGVTQVVNPSGGGSANQVIVNPGHVIMNGPFGMVDKLVPRFNIGQFSGVPGNGVLLAQNIPAAGNPTGAVVVIPEGALGANAGRVIILNDADYNSSTPAANQLPDSDVFMLNVFAYACGVPNVPGGNVYYFPQIAFNGGFTTEARVSSSSLTQTTQGWLFEFFDSAAAPVGTCGTLTRNLPPQNSDGCVLAGPASSPVRIGWARARSASSVRFFPSLEFVLRDGSGNLVSAVGVPPSTPGTSFTISGPFRSGSVIGLAFLNLPTSTGTANITVKGWNAFGTQVGTTGNITLAPGNQTAAFINQLVGAFSTTFDNSVTITSDQPIAVVGLVLDDPGSKLSTVPIFPGRK